jgi:hypothetical protein
MVLDENPVTLSLSRKRVYLDEERLDVKTVSIGKKRKNTTLKIILYVLAVLAGGVLLYASLHALIGSDEGGEAFQELDHLNKVEYRETTDMDVSSLFLVTETGEVVDLEGSVNWKSDSTDTIELGEAVSEPATLHLMWYGSANDLMTRDISHLRISIDSSNNHGLKGVELVVLDVDRSISNRIPVAISSSGSYEKGRSVYDIQVGRTDMGAARNNQSGLSSSSKGTLIRIEFPNGLDAGTIEISAEWGPDYYHEIRTMDILIGGFCIIITFVILFFVYSRVAKDEACLLVDTDEREYVLFGDNDELSKAYIEISKITIPKMKGAEERKKERPGITRGEDLVDAAEASVIGKELKKRPGGSGRMIVRQCPECLGTELYYESGFMTGYKYHCKNCDYVGSFVIEKQVNFDQ